MKIVKEENICKDKKWNEIPQKMEKGEIHENYDINRVTSTAKHILVLLKEICYKDIWNCLHVLCGIFLARNKLKILWLSSHVASEALFQKKSCYQ